MPPLVNNSRIVRFGAFEVDLHAGELRKSGIRLKLQEQPFQILSLLLEQPGEIVTREEFQKKLWPADTFVDFEHGLNTAITKLRQVLADEADNPRFIETLPRRGYRFIAPVTLAANGSSSNVQPAADVSEEAGTSAASFNTDTTKAVGASSAIRQFHWRTLTWLAALVLVCGLGVAAWIFYLRSTRPAWSEVRIAPLNGLPHESDAAFSPDGSQVAFVWAGPLQDRIHIYVSQIGGESPRRLTTSQWAEISPVWSPEGKYIAFLRFSRDRAEDGIYIASAFGGSERRVYPLQSAHSTKEIDWSPDGKYLSFAERNSPSEASSVYLLSLDTLEKHALTFPPRGILGDSDPVFSPDGKTVAFLRDSLDTQEIYLVSSEGGTPRQVTFDNRMIEGISWNSDGRDIIFSSNRGGTPSLWRIPASGGNAERLPAGSGGRAVRPTVARKGNRMAYTNLTYSSDIWRAELSVAGAKPTAPAKFITSTELEEGPQYSPDGKHIVFQSTRTGNYEIWRCDPDGSNLVQLTHFAGPLTGTPRWSPDSRQITFDTRPAGHSHVFVINAEGGQPRQLTFGESENGTASWSADGKFIYFASSQGGTWEVWKLPAQGGTPVQVTHQGGFGPQPSLDGKFIYYAKGRDLPGVWRVPVDGGEEKKIIDGPPPTGWGYFAVTDKGIYYGDVPNHTNMGVFFFDFKTEKSSLALALEHFGSEGAPGMSVSPDGRYILYTTLNQPTVNVMLVDNFHY
jgi:Tol biopolymer transport system component/DNA-binding winged helix-turn-helix (wHTH) protein